MKLWIKQKNKSFIVPGSGKIIITPIEINIKNSDIEKWRNLMKKVKIENYEFINNITNNNSKTKDLKLSNIPTRPSKGINNYVK